jgi:hypothetical protein
VKTAADNSGREARFKIWSFTQLPVPQSDQLLLLQNKRNWVLAGPGSLGWPHLQESVHAQTYCTLSGVGRRTGRQAALMAGNVSPTSLKCSWEFEPPASKRSVQKRLQKSLSPLLKVTNLPEKLPNKACVWITRSLLPTAPSFPKVRALPRPDLETVIPFRGA